MWLNSTLDHEQLFLLFIGEEQINMASHLGAQIQTRKYVCFTLSILLPSHSDLQVPPSQSDTAHRFQLWSPTFKFQWYLVIQQSWFARVNALCNLSHKKSREVAALFQANFCVGVASRCV